VSLEKVVATIDSPASHHGTDRPDAKYSDVFSPERRAKKRAGTKQTAIEAMTIAQSMICSCIGLTRFLEVSETTATSTTETLYHRRRRFSGVSLPDVQPEVRIFDSTRRFRQTAVQSGRWSFSTLSLIKRGGATTSAQAQAFGGFADSRPSTSSSPRKEDALPNSVSNCTTSAAANFGQFTANPII
jgi:hypothetical protein